MLKTLVASKYNNYEWLDLRYWYMTQPNTSLPYGYPVSYRNVAGLALYNKGGAKINTWEKYKSARAQVVQFCQLLTDAKFAGRRWYGYINETDLNRLYTDNSALGSFDDTVLPTSFFMQAVNNPQFQPYEVNYEINAGEFGFCDGTIKNRGCYSSEYNNNRVNLFYSNVDKHLFDVENPDNNPLPAEVVDDMTAIVSDGRVSAIYPEYSGSRELRQYLVNQWACISMPDDVLPIR
ncbi:hypothetical protein [Vibrio parahaemolyticus]|uniref:hypothetical protein n=1 Tax=Vibrio parahaemolyticus TaxID=670 RepID=UPI0038911F0B